MAVSRIPGRTTLLRRLTLMLAIGALIAAAESGFWLGPVDAAAEPPALDPIDAPAFVLPPRPPQEVPIDAHRLAECNLLEV